jgi:hypothetical protein
MELTPDLIKKISALEIARKEEEGVDNDFINLDDCEEVCEDCANGTDTPCTACLWEESVK